MIIELGIGAALAIGGYLKTRQFVRRRLRFVEPVRKPAVPLAVGSVVALAALPLAFLPFVGWLTAVGLGTGVGLGVKHGSDDSKRLPGF